MFDIIIAFLVVSVADQVMLSSECLTSEEKKCVFPFKVKEKTHTGCTKEGDPDKRYIESIYSKYYHAQVQIQFRFIFIQ